MNHIKKSLGSVLFLVLLFLGFEVIGHLDSPGTTLNAQNVPTKVNNSRPADCEYLHNQQMESLTWASKLPDLAPRTSALFGQSTAYGIAWQNCVARNK